MLERFLIDFAKTLKMIYTIGNDSPNWITKVTDEGIYIETESSRLKFKEGTTKEPGSLYPINLLLESWEIFKKKREITSDDVIHLGRRSSFLLAFYNQLPFIKLINERPAKLGFVEFTTDQLPEGNFDLTIGFLDDVISGKINPQNINREVTVDSEKRLKARARQGVRLLGFIDSTFKPVNDVVKGYQSSNQKNEFLKIQMLRIPYLKMVLETLKLVRTYSKKDKLELLVDIGLTIVRASNGDDLMKESVAEYRTRNILQWFERVGLVDEEWNILNEAINEEALTKKNINYWWVNQGKTHDNEKEGGFLWAPKQVKNGAALSHHIDLLKAEPGDIVFAYSNKSIRAICKVRETAVERAKPDSFSSAEWQTEGLLLNVDYSTLNPFIDKDDIPLEWRIAETGPFDRNGDVKQGYFYSVSKDFASKLFIKFSNSFPEEPNLYNLVSGESIIREGSPEEENFDSEEDLINHIHQFISNKGFFYEKSELINFYLSLKTKPFVILSGISGTGKTKIVQYFAESLGATVKNGRYKLIPVRPDWSDGSDLLGYKDIKGDFVQGPLTKVLLEASKAENRNKPYFVLLDEMNLARVEYYLSDLLSVMESREWENGHIVTSPVLHESSFNQPLLIPDNLYIVGTVNMDETTHPFSKKVLDRANTLEFNDVRLDYFDFDFDVPLNEMNPLNISNDHLKTKFLTLKDAYSGYETLVQKVSKQLMEINEILKINHAHIGYRVRDEICFYMIYNENLNLLSKEAAFDYQLHQKILPRLSGSDSRTDRVLKSLFQLCTSLELTDEQFIDFKEDYLAQAKYPKSAQKLAYMIRRQLEDGFTSFWIGS